MGVHIPGGLEKPMRSTTTGVALDLEFKNVPVALNAIVLMPSTTATVMLTLNNGKCSVKNITKALASYSSAILSPIS